MMADNRVARVSCQDWCCPLAHAKCAEHDTRSDATRIRVRSCMPMLSAVSGRVGQLAFSAVVLAACWWPKFTATTYDRVHVRSTCMYPSTY
jgi:hypothetical protein